MLSSLATTPLKLVEIRPTEPAMPVGLATISASLPSVSGTRIHNLFPETKA
jgi:hypothetical protein